MISGVKQLPIDDWLSPCMREVPRALLDTPREVLEDRARRWLTLQLGRLEDVSFGESFAEHCPVDGAEPKDYLQRVLDLGDGLRVLGGIRFRGGDGSFPFVDVLVSTKPLDGCLPRVLEALRAEWELFAPRAARVFVPEEPERARLAVGAELDQVFAAASLEAVEAKAPPLAEDLRVARVAGREVEACHAAMETAYAEFTEDHAALAARVPPAGLDQLGDCQSSGILLRIEDVESDACVGIFGVHRDAEGFFDEFCVCEEVLRRSHRGRGIAACVQGEAARLMGRAGQRGMLWGTIDASNTASRRTAARAGRPEVAAWAFHRLQ